ncbi:MAG: response regulator [Gemmataceae bacterium]
MLVLSRREGQRVHFPTLDVSVEVLLIKGNQIRLGIHAPDEVRVLRDELLPQQLQTSSKPKDTSARCAWNHDQRGRMNSAMMGLYLAEKQLQNGLTGDAETTLREAIHVLESLDRDFAAKETAKTNHGRHALLVEDDLNEEALLASYLRLSGFQVHTVHDGYEALEFLSQHDRPDFVLLDMRLPRLDGPSTVTAIRRNPAYEGLRIFAVTGAESDELRRTSMNPIEVDAWFRKPVNAARLVEAMSAMRSTN